MRKMSREYEALSKLIGKNFAVLEDGTSVHLTPEGEIRDVNDKLIMGADEGRAGMYAKNKAREGDGLPAGAGAHQQLVTDAEGVAKWEERTHYDAVEEGEILPEQTFTIGTEGAAFLTDPLAVALTPGETYTVRWNGATYEVIAQLLEEDGESIGTAIGNVDLANGVGDTGEPFVIVEFLEELVETMNGIRVQIIPLDGATAVTAKIIGKVQVVHKLDAKYLPEEVAPTPITFTLAADSTFTSDTTFSEAYKLDALALSKALRVCKPAGFGLGDTIQKEEWYSVSNVFKGAHWSDAPCIRCEFAVYADLLDYEHEPYVYELVWILQSNGEVSTEICFYSRLHMLPSVIASDDENITLTYHGKYKRWTTNRNFTVDTDGNGWFAGTVEGAALILPSSDGSRWQITVDDTGALSTAKL